jgi:acetyl esterase/lipase
LFRILACASVAIPLATAPIDAQRLLTSRDLASLTAPPPTERIQYGPGPLQFGRLRLPKRAGAGRHPVLVFIHGGCWVSAFDIAHAAALEQAIADSGIAVWSIEYRRIGDEGGGWPGTFLDVARGVDYLRTLAPRYGLDLNRVVVSGHSAGGHFALWVAARKKIMPTSELYLPDPLPVRAVFGLAPAPDLEALHASGACRKVMDELMGGSPSDHADRYAAGSPMRLAPIGLPQVLIVGALDSTWAPIGRAYAARARALGDTALQLIEAPNSGHFELIAPATSTWPIVIGALKKLFSALGQ